MKNAIKDILKIPINLIRSINLENFRTLQHALKTESPQQILQNFIRLIKGEARGGIQKQNGIFFCCDYAAILNDKLLIAGWTISPNDIESIAVVLAESNIGTTEYGRKRHDIAAEYPDIKGALLSGFNFEKELADLTTEEEPKEKTDKIDKIDKVWPRKIDFIVKDKNGTIGKFKAPLIDAQKEGQFNHLLQLNQNEAYRLFLDLNAPTEQEIEQTKEAAQRLADKNQKNQPTKPLISVIVPVYNVEPQYLDKCIESVINQYYPNWELCLYDDASPKQETVDALKKWKDKLKQDGTQDDRIKIKLGKTNKGISLASNEAIAMATGEYIALLDHDDELTPDALYEVAKTIETNKQLDKQLDFIYSDEDKLDDNGTRVEPYFKPGFNIDLLRSNNYITHLSVIRKSLGDQLGWFRAGYEGSQDHDLILRIVDATETSKIHHLPKILYHWRKVAGSTAALYSDKDYAWSAGKKALEDHLQRHKIDGTVEKGLRGGSFRIKRAITNSKDPQSLSEMVSIIIPFKDQQKLLKQCVDSILQKTDYPNYEIILVSNNSQEAVTLNYALELEQKHPNIHFYEYNVPFNYPEINNWAVQQTKGAYILLLNNDIEVINTDWLSAMVEHIQREEVAAVGSKLLYADNHIQHAGIVTGVGGIAGHAFKHLHESLLNVYPSMGLIRNVSGCTAACLLIKKQIYQEVGGMDEENLKVAFNDVDLCLKIRQKGHLIVYTPYAKLYHYESKSRGYEDTREKKERFFNETAFMKKKWGSILTSDPYYNTNLTLKREDFSLKLNKE